MQEVHFSSESLKEQAQKLFESGSEDDAYKGVLYLTLSDIKEAIEKKEWATAQRKIDRLDDKAKSNPIAQAMKKELDFYRK